MSLSLSHARMTRSNFKVIYLTVAAIAVLCGFLIHTLIWHYLNPAKRDSQIQSLESLIYSQDSKILLHDTRDLRNELIRTGWIESGRDFLLLSPVDAKERETITGVLNVCETAGTASCYSPEQVMVSPRFHKKDSQLEAVKYSVLLNSNKLNQTSTWVMFEVLAFSFVLLFLGLLSLAIRSREKVFLEKLSLLSESMQRMSRSFLVDLKDQNQDEFSALNQTIHQLDQALHLKESEIDRYKTRFEEKTRWEQLGRTVGEVSHNLRAPLIEGKNFIERLPDYIEALPQNELQEISQSIYRRFDRGLQSIDRAVQSLQQRELSKESICLSSLISEIVQRQRNNQIFGELTVDFEFPDFDAVIQGNREKIESVFENLLKNTFEAKNDAHVSIKMNRTTDGMILVDYQDDGPGIPKQDRNKVFELLYSTKASGSGLGLFSSFETLKLHRGEIRLKDSLQGAWFEMRIPQNA